jgi:glycosyltransferase involved in cell wall biosynthesis
VTLALPSPLVSCIMPTHNRRWFVERALGYFLRQQYVNKELIIVDDGTDPVGDLVPDNGMVRYIRVLDKAPIGAKRNLACQQARGTLIAHWDDDDWHSPHRLEYQVRALLSAGTGLCGISALLFYDPRSGQAWRYIYPPDQRPWLSGSSLLYRRDFWESHPFPDINVGEDAQFIWSAPPEQLAILPDHSFHIGIVHASNVSPKDTKDAWWHPIPIDEIRQLLGDDWAVYHAAFGQPAHPARPIAKLQKAYERACQFAASGRQDRARRLYRPLAKAAADTKLKAMVQNDLAALVAADGDTATARHGFETALATDGNCALARANLRILDTHALLGDQVGPATHTAVPLMNGACNTKTKVAILSFLFNWPSTAGGIVHTVELALFLERAGYEVAHFFARYPAWGIGRLEGTAPFAGKPICFDDSDWTVQKIQDRFRQAVDAFGPDYVIITDCWNFKPLLAEAVHQYPYILRQQALECLCPLNNLRFVMETGGQVRQCPLHQLVAPQECHRCLRERGHLSGGLHQHERALSGVGTPEYDAKLRRALSQAEAVLVHNPLTQAMLSPYVRSARVVTWGMDPARFPWPYPSDPVVQQKPRRTKLLMAGVVQEVIKGFHILHDACKRLWRKRQDFQLLATGEPPGQVDEFTQCIGWFAQERIPQCIRDADVLVMPTIAQEGLGRTTVEAMGVGRPVIASRIGGLPYTVTDGLTGLLCEPGDSRDLAEKIELLLDNPELCHRMGLAGRQQFEQDFTWPVIIDRHYRPLLRTKLHSQRGSMK